MIILCQYGQHIPSFKRLCLSTMCVSVYAVSVSVFLSMSVSLSLRLLIILMA